MRELPRVLVKPDEYGIALTVAAKFIADATTAPGGDITVPLPLRARPHDVIE